jgi:pseudouridine-5'-phosphate glycosidase
MSLDSTHDIASFIHEKKRMNLQGGTLIANPIPEEFEIPQLEIEPAIEKAIAEASKIGVSGKDLTPFLLSYLNELTQGRSQRANKQLVLNNAAVAAQIAVDLVTSRKKHAFIAL